MWQKDVSEYCKTCDRCQKANKSTGKRLGNMIKIQQPSRPWEIVHMYWLTGLPPGVDRSYNAFLVIVDRFSKTPIFLPCHKDDTAINKALLIWNKVVSWTGLFTNIISDRDPKFTQHYGQIFNNYLGQSPSSLQPTTHKLRCTLLPVLELAYKTSTHASENQTPAIPEKGWYPKLAQDSLRKDLIELKLTAASSIGMLVKARKHAVRCMDDSFSYAKEKWEKSHATQDLKVRNLALHGKNAVEVELSEELSNKHPTFPVSLIKPYKSSDSKNFLLRNKAPQVIPPIESSSIEKITKVLKERKLRTDKLREYLVRYSDPTCEDEWLAEKDIPKATKLLRRFRNTRNNNIQK
ncbi:hypothetical protein O181_001830 [Austropuccinia psidii MF-1]|uniref:Integrase catalytic domain-containing protein n=1 Tax=Austropuccinia psidii MF-1 TaxID=1389203 RepID=A0A9Q3GC88_9BASI|nr:hypothetical protein [Austropuccinia psidii MF-1]